MGKFPQQSDYCKKLIFPFPDSVHVAGTVTKIMQLKQTIIDRAVNIATKSALNGHPVERIIWHPPVSATDDYGGIFIIVPFESRGAADTAPWEK